MTSRWEAEEEVEPEEEKEEGVREQRNERSDVRRVIERKRAPQKMIIVAIATNHGLSVSVRRIIFPSFFLHNVL